MKDGLSDRIFLENLSIRARHGVRPEEKETEQEFLIDISVTADTAPASGSDALEQAINYGTFRDIALDVLGGAPVNLIETLAETIAQRILEDTRIEAVTVSIRKPEIYDDCTPGVSITRSRV